MLNIIFRTVIIFTALLVLMRLLGKRQMGELELSELVVSILVADVASIPLQDAHLPLWTGLLPTVVLVALEALVSWATMRSVRLRNFLCGRPCFLIVNGVIQQDAMRRTRFTMDELAEELRSQNVTDIAAVRYGVLETDGSLNVILRPDQRPVTAGLLGITEEDDGYATILIQDGVVMRRNLQLHGKDEAWLLREAKRRGCQSLREIYTLILYENGKIFFAKKDAKP